MTYFSYNTFYYSLPRSLSATWWREWILKKNMYLSSLWSLHMNSYFHTFLLNPVWDENRLHIHSDRENQWVHHLLNYTDWVLVVCVICYMYYAFLHVTIIQCVFVAITGSLVLYMCSLEANTFFHQVKKADAPLNAASPTKDSKLTRVNMYNTNVFHIICQISCQRTR